MFFDETLISVLYLFFRNASSFRFQRLRTFIRNSRMYLFHLFDVLDRRLYWRKFVECYNKIDLRFGYLFLLKLQDIFSFYR